MFAAYWADPGQLWRDPLHDRNTHYLNGLNLALDLAAGDAAAFMADAIADPVWPPLHATILSLVLGLGGLDHRLAILPSLAGWCGTVVMAWLLAGRARPGWLAGVVAAGLAIASPAFRLLGSDVMLEGLGSALGAACLYGFVRSGTCPAGQSWRVATCVLLTLLFLEKFNYWLLVLAALALTVVMEHPGAVRAVLRALARAAAALVLSPAGLLGGAGLAAAVALAAAGPLPVTLLGRGFLVYPDLVLTATYGVLLLRACQIWRRERAGLPASVTCFVRWHAAPVALWLLVPHALIRFLWFLGPTHSGASQGYDPWRALLFHWQGFSQGFHAPAAAAPVLALAALGGAALITRGGRARCIPVFAALSTIVLVLHPQQQWRFQATALIAVWVCAGVGAAAVFARTRLPGAWAAAVAGGLLLLAGLPAAPLANRVAIRTPEAPSDLALAQAYLPLLAGTRSVGAVATFGLSDLFAWTIREACRCRAVVDQPWLAPASSPSEVADLTAAWLDRMAGTFVVLVDAPPRRDALAGVEPALASDPRLVPSFSAVAGSAKVGVWRATPPPPHPQAARMRLDAMLSAALAGACIATLLFPRRLARPDGPPHHPPAITGRQE